MMQQNGHDSSSPSIKINEFKVESTENLAYLCTACGSQVEIQGNLHVLVTKVSKVITIMFPYLLHRWLI